MSNRTDGGFDPETILVALQGAGVASVLIGGLARVARGADEVTRGVDICPSEQPANLERLAIALDSLGAARADGRELELEDAAQGRQAVEVRLATQRGGHRDEVSGGGDLGPQAGAEVLGRGTGA
jgi:hypothetical protein